MSAVAPSELRTLHPPHRHTFRSIEDIRLAIGLTKEKRLLDAFPNIVAQAQPILQLFAATW